MISINRLTVAHASNQSPRRARRQARPLFAGGAGFLGKSRIPAPDQANPAEEKMRDGFNAFAD